MPDWLPAAPTPQHPPMYLPLTFPPITQLRHFESDLMVHNNFPGQLAVPEFHWQDLILQTCWFLYMNIHLTSVTIDRMSIRTVLEWNRLLHALAILKRLSELVVGPLPILNKEHGGWLLRLFFDSLPSTLIERCPALERLEML